VRRLLRALQVEVTSRCTRRCALCPRTALADRWLDGDLPEDLWQRLEPDLSLAEHVHLQGWGEPLMHPGLPRMIRAAKDAGCTVGITTNGDLLEANASWLPRSGLDLVTLSVAGGPETHARLKGGSDLPRMLATAVGLFRKRSPRVQLSYLLTRDNARELPSLVERAAAAGIREVFAIHLDCTPDLRTLERAAFAGDELAPDVAPHLAAAEAAARRHRVRFRGPAQRAEELLVCALDPSRFAFVSWDGRVGPCVNLQLPIAGEIPRAQPGGLRTVEAVCYGRLQQASLAQLIAGTARQGFAAAFERRLAAEQAFAAALPTGLGVEALRQLELADARRQEALAACPLPDACAGCHKARGW
jgi:MoaA/NifB/PqqE/SkfB family radical SAM enzyme